LRALRQQFELSPVVEPAHRFLQPAWFERDQRRGSLGRRRQVPGAVDVDHQVSVVADDISDDFEALNVFGEFQATNLGLEASMALFLEFGDLVTQLCEILTVAIIGTSYVIGHLVTVATKQLIERQPGHLADNIPARDIDRRRDPHKRLATPALLMSQAFRRQREQVLINPFGRQWIGADQTVRNAALEDIEDRRSIRVTGCEPKAFDAVIRPHAQQDLICGGNGEIADPMRSVVFWSAQNEDVDFGDLCCHGLVPQ